MIKMKNLFGKKITINLIALLSALLLCVFLGLFASVNVETLGIGHEKADHVSEIREGGFKFINPLMECESEAGHLINRELKPFRYKIDALVESRIDHHDAVTISVYFRDLNNGSWFGINENEKFAPASLLKVPLMIAYFKRAESDPQILNKKLTYSGESDRTKMQNIKPEEMIEAGRSYTVDNLIFRMIAFSDNNAVDVLSRNMPEDYVKRVFRDLNVDYDPDANDDFMSVRGYASFYRILYNSSYLGKAMSEKALNYLSYIDFRDGIVAGVPPSVPVASKFGERTIVFSGQGAVEIKQLHEFGIVYSANRPYLLGVMTRGHDLKKLASVIRDVSRSIYDEVDHQTK